MGRYFDDGEKVMMVIGGVIALAALIYWLITDDGETAEFWWDIGFIIACG